jgi:hypothetical protein
MVGRYRETKEVARVRLAWVPGQNFPSPDAKTNEGIEVRLNIFVGLCIR